MNSIISLFVQDFKLLLRNAIFWVVSATLVIIILVVNFLIPKDFSPASPGLIVHGMNIPAEGVTTASSHEEAEQLVKETGNIGVLLDDTGFTILSGNLSDQAAAALVATLTANDVSLSQFDVVRLNTNVNLPTQNLRMMPVLLSFEAVVLGFLMAAILMLGEKQDQVLKAYRISPGGTFAYISGKVLLFAAIGSVYAWFMTVTTVGFGFHMLHFLLLTILGCILYTLLGLCVAVFFQDISGWFFAAVLILSLNMLPMVSFQAPSFSPAWIRYIPSYPMLFAYRDILFAQSKNLLSTYALYAFEIATAFGLCTLLIKKKLLSDD